MRCELGGGWREILGPQLEEPYFRQLGAFVDGERDRGEVFPSEADVFRAFDKTPYEAVKVLLLGQDPYHDEGQAHGLAFSVRAGVRPPPSLTNVFKELESDVGILRPLHGQLDAWAERGVLLLNTVLTVRAHEPASHRAAGWERFTDEVIRALDRRTRPLVFLLWGTLAHKKRKLVDETRHRVITSAHPSPLSAHRGFLGSRPFSRVNEALAELGHRPIDWRLGDL
jgi:uracil-DNA glycosylase